MTSTFSVRPGGQLQGTFTLPGDKSISHRSIMLAAIAEGDSLIHGFLTGEDSLATLAAFQAMGVDLTLLADQTVQVKGVGKYGLIAPSQALNVGNSGTAMRLLAGLLSAQSFDSRLIGDASLSKRPMGRIIEPLQQMGARIDAQTNGLPPLHIHGGVHLQGMSYRLPVASAQVKSGILLAGLYADAPVQVIEPEITRDHTERMLASFGVELIRHDDVITLQPPQKLIAQEIRIPSDISSAAFFMVGACIAPGSAVCLQQVGINPTRIGILNILTLMGADIRLENRRMFGSEPVADVYIQSAPLQGLDIPLEQVSLAIDEFPAIFVAAACAQGVTRLSGAAELRVKESDRLAVMAEGLSTLGIAIKLKPDGIEIKGGRMQGGEIQSHGDHRIAMAFAMAGLCCEQPITIRDCENVATSFPGFVDLAAQAGLSIFEEALA